MNEQTIQKHKGKLNELLFLSERNKSVLYFKCVFGIIQPFFISFLYLIILNSKYIRNKSTPVRMGGKKIKFHSLKLFSVTGYLLPPFEKREVNQN